MNRLWFVILFLLVNVNGMYYHHQKNNDHHHNRHRHRRRRHHHHHEEGPWLIIRPYYMLFVLKIICSSTCTPWLFFICLALLVSSQSPFGSRWPQIGRGLTPYSPQTSLPDRFSFFSTNFNRGNHTKLRPVVGVLREQLLRHGDVRLAQGLEVFPPKHFAANLQDHIGLPRGKVILQGVLLQSLALSGDQCQSRVRVAYPAFFENATPVFRLSSNYGCCVIPMAFETHMLDSNNIWTIIPIRLISPPFTSMESTPLCIKSIANVDGPAKSCITLDETLGIEKNTEIAGCLPPINWCRISLAHRSGSPWITQKFSAELLTISMAMADKVQIGSHTGLGSTHLRETITMDASLYIHWCFLSTSLLVYLIRSQKVTERFKWSLFWLWDWISHVLPFLRVVKEVIYQLMGVVFIALQDPPTEPSYSYNSSFRPIDAGW